MAQKYTYGSPGQAEGSITSGRLATEILAAVSDLTGYSAQSWRDAGLAEVLASGIIAGTNAAAAGSLTGATLASGVTASSLTSLGTIASLVATTADINGGTFDGIVGGTTPADGSFTTLSATGLVTFNTGGVSTNAFYACVAGGGSGAGHLFATGGGGLVLQAITGSTNDFDIRTPAGAGIMTVATGTTTVDFKGALTIAGNAGFYGQVATAKPTGVAVSAAGIHAALVTLNLIAA